MKINTLLVLCIVLISCTEKPYIPENSPEVPENFDTFLIVDDEVMKAYHDPKQVPEFIESTEVNRFWMQQSKYEWEDVHKFYQQALVDYKEHPLKDVLLNKTITILVRDFELISNQKDIPNHVRLFYAKEITRLRSSNFSNSYELLNSVSGSIMEKEEVSERASYEIFKLNLLLDGADEDIQKLKNDYNSRNEGILKSLQETKQEFELIKQKLQSLL